MRLQALLPLLVHRGEPRSALVIGLGTGITAGALLRYPGLDRRVCAELLPAVVQAAPLFHGNYGVATDSRLDLRVRDGRRELLRSSERYDVITLEPPPPSAMGVVNLYSRDFYALAGHRLTGQRTARPVVAAGDAERRGQPRHGARLPRCIPVRVALDDGAARDAAAGFARADRAGCGADRRALRSPGGGGRAQRGGYRISRGAAGHVDRRSRRARALRIAARCR